MTNSPASSRSKWSKKPVDPEEVRNLSQRYGIGLLEATILVRRGIVDPKDLLSFLEDDLRFTHNPFLFSGMEDAVDRILAAHEEDERVLVFGDRDVDGVSATVLLVEALRDIGLSPFWKVPEGDAAYGLSLEAVETFAAEGGGLIVTVDCGISNVREVEAACALGVDVVIVDHHVPPENQPPALVIIDPKSAQESYPFANLAATTVVAKLVWALRFARTPMYNQRLCVLNVRREEGDLVVEACRLVNLVETKRLYLVFNDKSGYTDLEALVSFLQDQEIYVFDEKAQLRLLRQLFGPSVEIGVFDLAPGIRKAFPALANLDFSEIRAKSRLPRYNSDAGELDILVSLFLSSVYKTFPSLGSDFLPVLDLTALATLADLMPLEGENRVLVKLGMQALNRTRRSGLRALMMRLRLLGRPLSTTDVSWYLTPVLNAAGRMGEPGKAIELLLSDDDSRRRELAEHLEGLNQARKQMSLTAWEKVLPPARRYWEASGERFTLVRDPSIPRGITGILASRLMNTLGSPALVMTHQDERIVGSLRTNRGFETRRFLDSFADLFIDYGGHSQAAGFQLPLSLASDFLQRLEKILPDFSLEVAAEESLEIDAEVPLEYLKADLIRVVDLLEPYGEGSRPLVFATKGLRILELDLVGKSNAQHARLTLDAGAVKWPAIWWNSLERLERREFSPGVRVDVAFQLGRNFYQGQESLQMTVLDLRRS